MIPLNQALVALFHESGIFIFWFGLWSLLERVGTTKYYIFLVPSIMIGFGMIVLSAETVRNQRAECIANNLQRKRLFMVLEQKKTVPQRRLPPPPPPLGSKRNG
jgi:hypothetical protein